MVLAGVVAAEQGAEVQVGKSSECGKHVDED